MKVINFFGGPGTGKSTTAADTFALMKWNNKNVELIDEYAKQVTWEGRKQILGDQLYMLAKQNRKLQRLSGQVDYVITDSPIIMSLPYTRPDYCPAHYRHFVRELWNTYDNINIFLQRHKPYHAVGRSQNENEARALDAEILDLLYDLEIPFIFVKADQNARDVVMQRILELELKNG